MKYIICGLLCALSLAFPVPLLSAYILIIIFFSKNIIKGITEFFEKDRKTATRILLISPIIFLDVAIIAFSNGDKSFVWVERIAAINTLLFLAIAYDNSKLV